MASLTEAETYETGIYQLEITDPVIGGANGVDNLQAKQLANRTAWLKKQFTDLFSGAISVVKATKLTTARLINGESFDGSTDINIEARLGAAIASAATTTIGTKGSGDSAHITGTTTITSFGVSTTGTLRIITFDGILTLTHNATSLILPTGANIVTAAGDTAEFVCENGASGYWRCTGYQRKDGTAVSINAITQAVSDNSTKIATTAWVVTAMATIATAAGFAISTGANGYIKLPSWLGGLIMQWGTSSSIPSGGTLAITFPISFVSACLNVQASGTLTSDVAIRVSSVSISGCVLGNSASAPAYNSSIAQPAYWLTIGY